MLSRGNPDVQELDSREWQEVVQSDRLVTDVPEGSEDQLTVFDDDQTVKGLMRPEDGGESVNFEYSYTQLTDVAAQLDEQNVRYEVDPQTPGSGSRSSARSRRYC